MTRPDLSLIVTNARISTGNPATPWATALGIEGGKLAVIGVAAEILKMTGDDTRIIDAGGQILTLPAGMEMGSRVTVTVAPDRRVTLHAGEPR